RQRTGDSHPGGRRHYARVPGGSYSSGCACLCEWRRNQRNSEKYYCKQPGVQIMTDYILCEKHDATLVITLNRPERRNAFDLEVRQSLSQAVLQSRDDDTVKAVVITGTQGVFCAGGDLKSLSAAKRPIYKDRERIRLLHTWFQELV